MMAHGADGRRPHAGGYLQSHAPKSCASVSGLTPARIMEVVHCLNVVEMMMALQKMRARRTPSNQAHVTNKREHPALLAADAAEAVERGFSELETTVGVARYAPFNALAILIGSQTGRGSALTQCAVEEALGLRLGFPGPDYLRGDALRLRHGAGIS